MRPDPRRPLKRLVQRCRASQQQTKNSVIKRSRRAQKINLQLSIKDEENSE